MNHKKILNVGEKSISRRNNLSVGIKDSTAGITLIALVITIIVLLILAGVAISMLSGENGILKQAASAKTEYSEAQQKEEQKVEELAWEISAQTSKTKLTMKEGITKYSNKTVKDLNKELPEGYKVADKDGNIITDDTQEISSEMTIVKNNKIVSKIVVTGDVNEDGIINVSDSGVIQNFINGNIDIEKDYIKVAMDVNNDGKINNSDAYLVNLYDGFVIEEFPDKGYKGGTSSIKVERILEVTVDYDVEEDIPVVAVIEDLLNEGETIGDVDGKTIKDADKETTYIATGMTILKNNEIVGRVVLIGDVNGDGGIDMFDVIEIVNHCRREPSVIKEDYQKVAADVNNDGKINIDVDEKMLQDMVEWNINKFERGNYQGGPSLIEIEYADSNN